MIEVELTWAEVWLCLMVATQREFRALVKYAKDRNGNSNLMGLDSHFCGALGECALAKWRKMFWSGSYGNFAAADVGSWYQVRGVWRTTDHLIFYEWDKREQPFVLAICLREKLPIVILRGWMYGRDGIQRANWQDWLPRPTYGVKPDKLHHMDTFPYEEQL